IKNKYESHIVANDKKMVDSEMINLEMVDSEMVDLKRQKNEIIQIEQEKLKNNNYFCSSWALKKNQEYEKRRRDKHMTEIVKEILKPFFHAGDEDKSKRYMAKEMLQDLQQRVQTGELEANKIQIIKN
ncbi:13353_t:CDS:1, partial [Gigaspora margarita]